jgi:hypothetical protein
LGATGPMGCAHDVDLAESAPRWPDDRSRNGSVVAIPLEIQHRPKLPDSRIECNERSPPVANPRARMRIAPAMRELPIVRSGAIGARSRDFPRARPPGPGSVWTLVPKLQLGNAPPRSSASFPRRHAAKQSFEDRRSQAGAWEQVKAEDQTPLTSCAAPSCPLTAPSLLSPSPRRGS